MKIVAIDTLRFDAHGNLLIVRLRTDAGVTGLGETYFEPAVTEAYIHGAGAAALLGADVTGPNELAHRLVPYVGYAGSGAEMRARSALDIALWDLLGRTTNLPLVQLLGGAVRQDIPVYNTCAGYRYVQSSEGQSVNGWGLPTGGESNGPYEDLEAFLVRPGELAQELLDQGIGGMKIWPFDPYAERHAGLHIDRGELARGVAIVEAIRDAVGDAIDVMIELHGLWQLPAARRIAHALEGLDITWLEDPIRPDRSEALAQLAASTSIPIAGGETVAGADSFRRLLDLNALDVPIVDPTWAGGVSESVRIAAMAQSFAKPFAAHDCTGPISLALCCHLAVSQPNAFVQEIVRAFYYGWYSTILTELPPLERGHIAPPAGPGIGVDLQPDLDSRPGVRVRTSRI